MGCLIQKLCFPPYQALPESRRFQVKIEGKTRIFPIKLYGDKLAARKAAVTFQQRVTRMLTRCEVMKGQARI